MQSDVATIEGSEVPTSRAERSEALRRRIVLSALEAFSHYGSGMSLSAVAQGAGISKQLLLYHFKSKAAVEDAVLELLIRRSHHDVSGLISAALLSQEAGIAALQERFVDDPPAAIRGSRGMLRFLLDGTPEQRRRIDDGTRGWFDSLVIELRAGQREGRLRPDLDAEAVIPQIGMLLLTNMALLAQGEWSGRTPAAWQQARLEEFIRVIRHILLPG